MSRFGNKIRSAFDKIRGVKPKKKTSGKTKMVNQDRTGQKYRYLERANKARRAGDTDLAKKIMNDYRKKYMKKVKV